MNKATEFIVKYGYSYKSYFIALIVFPPACYLIAWKIPDIKTITRVLLTIIAVVIPTAIVMLGGLAVFEIFK